MPFHERVAGYTVAQLHNDVVDYDQVIHLTLKTSGPVFIGFPEQQPTDWLTFGSDGTTTVFLQSSQFDGVYHLLQSESPVYCTALSVLGLRAFDLTTGEEPTGEGPADHDALAQFMRDAHALRVRGPDPVQ
jgi:hypothetical protein